MKGDTKCTCGMISSNYITCFEIKLCLMRTCHSIYISQTIKQEGKRKKYKKTSTVNLPFVWKTAPTPLWFTLVCLTKWTKSVPKESKVDSSGNGTGSDKVRLWQPGFALQKEMPCVPDSSSTSSYALPWQSGQGNNPLSPCRAHNMTRLSPGAHRCKYFCISSWKCKTNKSSKGIGISLTHHRDRKKQAHNQYVTWALLVSPGRSKLPVFPLNVLVLVLTGSLVSR